MKSDAEFLAGIYTKAEEAKKNIDFVATREKVTAKLFRFSAWQGAVAAAVLCLIVVGAAHFGRSKDDVTDYGVMTAQENSDNGLIQARDLSVGSLFVKGVVKNVTEFATADDAGQETVSGLVSVELFAETLANYPGLDESLEINLPEGIVFSEGEEVSLNIIQDADGAWMMLTE